MGLGGLWRRLRQSGLGRQNFTLQSHVVIRSKRAFDMWSQPIREAQSSLPPSRTVYSTQKPCSCVNIKQQVNQAQGTNLSEAITMGHSYGSRAGTRVRSQRPSSLESLSRLLWEPLHADTFLSDVVRLLARFPPEGKYPPLHLPEGVQGRRHRGRCRKWGCSEGVRYFFQDSRYVRQENKTG